MLLQAGVDKTVAIDISMLMKKCAFSWTSNVNLELQQNVFAEFCKELMAHQASLSQSAQNVRVKAALPCTV